uniref:P/Homo B domain-containing protein n=1 Tax=Knipowitschia caucasica TaxID=637954 RepID=A0AAV2MQD7_KNICA
MIGDLKDHYHFFHSRTIKRSTLSSRGRHSFISMEPKVEWIQQQVVKRRIKRDYKIAPPLSLSSPAHNTIHFNDAKWSNMWYIHCNDDVHNCQSDMNIMGAWKRGYTGRNVVVTILDDGIERNHPDLSQNYDAQASFDVNGNDVDPMPRYDATNENKHGTRCAGEVAAAANNSHCIVGIAYNARIGGVRMLDGDVTDMVEAKSLSLHPQHIDIYSASWGPDDDGKTVDGPASLARQSFENGIRMGRKGRGSIFVWASGNGGRSRDHCSCDGYTNSIYTISISSTAESGRKPWYLEECSSTLTTTYSSGENYDRKIMPAHPVPFSPSFAALCPPHPCAFFHFLLPMHACRIPSVCQFPCFIVRTTCPVYSPDKTGSLNLPMHAPVHVTDPAARFLSLTPIVCQTPLLTWRDVQHIIVKTSRAGHLIAPDWKTNAAGYNVSHLYGFGLMDAEAMVKEAERWKQVPAQHVCVESADRQMKNIRPEHVVRSVYKATGCPDSPNNQVIYLEHVVVRITILHPRRGDLSINLTSPSGTKSQLLANRLFDHSTEGFKNWEFMTTHCWGEKAAGDWVLEIYDSPFQLRSQKVPGKLKEWSLVLYGTSVHPYTRSDKPRSVESPTEEEFTEEYNGPCDPECNEGCEGPGPHHCINCLHYFLKFKNNTKMCVSECPSGFFRDDRKRCKKCSSSCETCVGSRSDQCSTCRPGFHLNEGSNTCVANCAEAFYLDQDSNICRRCPENCKKCTSANICTECKPGTSLQGNRCQMTCDSGTYYNGHRRTCEPCHRACATCAGTGIEACTKCADGYILEDWRCVSTCSSGYYLSETLDQGLVQRACKKCDHSCYECLGPGERNCSTCVSGYNLEGGACVVSTICKDANEESWAEGSFCVLVKRNNLCQRKLFLLQQLKNGKPLKASPGQYMSAHGQCHLCDTTCLRCSGPEREDCTRCPNSRVYDNGRCDIRCQRGRYTLDKQCYPCHHTCNECTDAGPDNCTSCDKDAHGVERFLFEGQCRLSCPEGHFHSLLRRCELCPEHCSSCASALLCVHCGPGHRLRAGHCVPLQCSQGEVADSRSEACVPCDEGCKECRHKDEGAAVQSTVCVHCEEDYYQLGSDCHRSCPDGSFSLEEQKKCVPCEDKRCLNCDQNQCYWCKEGFYVSEGLCVEHCSSGFIDEESQACEPCHRSCASCGGPRSDDCDTCASGFSLSGGECLPSTQKYCADGFYSQSLGSCRPCSSSCSSCSGPNRTDCLSCSPGQFLTPQQTCMSRCPSGTFSNSTSGRCEECHRGCMVCEHPMQCLSCHHGLMLQEGVCVDHCLRGFPQAGVCVPCLPQCSSCQGNSSTCLSCEPPYLHSLDHTCRERCAEGSYSTGRECEACPPDCSQCDHHGLCTKCAQFYFLHQDGCVDDCPSGFFVDSQDHECLKCHRECSSCDGPDSDDCIVCSNPSAVRFRGECLGQCPHTTYYDRATNECRDCDMTCLTCSDHLPSSCASCAKGRVLDATGHCVWYNRCAASWYLDSKGDCQKCHSSCESCSGPTADHCISCNSPHFLLNSSCLQQCPEGFFTDSEVRVCERCHWSCARCSGRHSLQCKRCREGFYTQAGGCVPTCSPSHFGNPVSMACERCDPSCDSCSGPGSSHCLSCRENFLYLPLGQQCVQRCPDGYYKERKSKTCRRCHPTCKTCSDEGAIFCLSCYEGYKFFGGICESNCLVGNYQNSSSALGFADPVCVPCDVSCFDCRGPSQWNCTLCEALRILADDGRCLSCCGREFVRAGEAFSWECCDCQASREQCVLSVNRELRLIVDTEQSAAAVVSVSVCVLLILCAGGGLFYYLHYGPRASAPGAKGGYEALSAPHLAPPPMSFDDELSRRIIEADEDEEEEEEEDQDIVYMSQDGTVYRKFKYGLLQEDDELEYDDESYAYT